MSADSWRLPEDRPWIWERIEESWFLFNPRSNETHVLNEATVAVLDLLQQGIATTPEIVTRLARDLPSSTESDPVSLYRGLLRELDRLGLIVPAAP
ncbi:MAG: HPr-rel-A system PqqD family peptide chaperone [Magnetococcales bacterium]|nr:HPr-rel-A system PqqD family peptide chaperone [Magnetococcales bacterium]